MPSYDQYRALLRSEQMAADLSAARELAEDQQLIANEALEGQYEMMTELEAVNQSLGSLQEASERANEIAEDQAREQEEHNEMMLDQARQQSFLQQQQAQEAVESRETLHNIRDIGVFGLVLSGVTAMATTQSAEHLEHISSSLDASEGWLENINDGIWSLDEGLDQANETLEQIKDEIRDTGDQICRVMCQVTAGMTKEIIVAQRQLAEQHEQSAERRHRDLLSKLITPLANEAEEKFAQAQTLYRTYDNGLCARELKEVFKRVRTHELGWTLFGQLLIRLGQPKLAREAFARAARFALDKKNLEAYAMAMVHWSHLERVVGNYQRAYDLMKEVQATIEEDSPLYPWIRYELLKAFWVLSKRTYPPILMWHNLQELFYDWPELRDEVAVLPLWKDLVKTITPLRFGNFRYIQLAEMWFSRKQSGNHGVEIVGPNWTTYLPRFTNTPMGKRNYDQTLDLALELIWEGKVDCPEAVSKHLDWLQDETIGLRHHERASLELAHFIGGFEALVLFVCQGLKHRGQSDRAEVALKQQHLSWNYCHHHLGRPKMIMPKVAFEQFKSYLGDEKALKQHLYELSEIFLADPRLRDDFNNDQRFKTVRKLCPWLTFRNVRYARLYEAIGYIENELTKLSDLSVGELQHFLHSMSEMLRQRDWGRGKFTAREQQLFTAVEEWLDQLYEDVCWPEFNPDSGQECPTEEATVIDFLANEGGRIRFASLLKRLASWHDERPTATLLDNEMFQEVEAELKILYASRMTISVIYSVEHAEIFTEYRASRAWKKRLEAKALARRQAEEQARLNAEQAEVDEKARLEAEALAKRQAEERAQLHAQRAAAKEEAEHQAEAEYRRNADLQKAKDHERNKLILRVVIGILIIMFGCCLGLANYSIG